jgi:N-acetylneuraminic acid mutarotase
MKTKTSIIAILLAAGLTSSSAQDTWTRKADFGGVAREGATGLNIGSNGYIGLGAEYPTSYKDFWEYDPNANTWTQKADFGGPGRLYAVGFTIAGKGYVGTGQSGSFPNYTYYNDFWEYDPNSNVWTQKANFGGTARYGAAGFSIDSKGYLGTGTDGLSQRDFWEFDPIQNTWTQKADFGGTERVWATGLSIGAKGYFGLGGGPNGTLKDFWEYDPSTNVWLQKADFGGPARQVPASFSIGNKGYVGTGENENTTSLKDFWEFDPSVNTWSQKADFGGTGRNQAAGFSIGSKGYIGTGVNPSGYKKDFWEYTPEETSIAIDIKPGTFPNSINPRGKGVIPVAILTTDTFDATAVDPTTVRFGPNGTEAAPVQSALEDVDGDGDTDMILHFKTQDTGIVCGDTSASLTGETFSGEAIEGSDSIKTVGCK